MDRQQDKKEFPDAFFDDIDFLKEVRAAVLETLQCTPVTSTSEVSYGQMPDKRPLRTVFPQGRELVISLMSKCDMLHFVGFIGFRKPENELDDKIKKDIWNIDNELVEELNRYSNIVGYFSAERTDGYNWGNLVVCQSCDAINEWMKSKTHTTAAIQLSPRYYSQVRIHSGHLKGGLSGEVEVVKTIFLDYVSPQPVRSVVYWDT